MGDFFGGIGRGLLELVLPSMATVISGFVILVLKRIAKKHGLEITEQQEQRLKQIVVDKVHMAEEAGRRDPTIKGVDKFQMAANEAMKAAVADKLIPDPTLSQVSQTIDAMLPVVRAGWPNPGLPGLGKR